MALNDLIAAQKYSNELDKIVTQKSVTGFFADNVFASKFVGAKTVLVPDMDFIGLGDYDRDNGFPQGKITVSNTSFTLSKDRGRELQLDRMDMDETGVAGLAGKTLNEFVRTKVIPEMDAYNISKLAGVAKSRSNTSTFVADNAFKLFNEAVAKVQDKAGYDAELVCFVDTAAYSALMNTPELQKHIVVSDFKQGEIDIKVKKINDVAIVPVTSDRMKSAYTFSTNGFAPASGAENINMLILPKGGASLVKKTEELRIFEPKQNQDADAYKFQYRIYYDIFVKKSNVDLIHVVTSA